MPHWKKLILLLLSISFFISCQNKDAEFKNALEFISAADMRNFVMNEERSAKHFVGALETIKEIGAGSFMVSTGDIDPPQAVLEAIEQILGKEYVWYPIVGNHELDAPEHMEFLRNYNKNGSALPNLVREGPPGCKETTYSFDWANCHFVALNQYFDGNSDTGTDGDVVPELLQWLEEDLSSTSKEHIVVLGHEPMFPMPDMDTGRLRHYDDSINKYMDNNVAFLHIMQEYDVNVYICGHTHNTSYCNINGLWQIDTGHSRGLEGASPELYFDEVLKRIEIYKTNGYQQNDAINKFYTEHPDQKTIRKGLDFMDFCGVLSYKEITNQQAITGLINFYSVVQKGQESISELHEKFWNGANYTPSTLIKFYMGINKIKAEFYRDDGRGGYYSLRKTLILD